MRILKQFSQSKEHANAQCCVVCLMSHGEEGSLSVQDGKKVSILLFFLYRSSPKDNALLFSCRSIMIMYLISSAMLIVRI